MDLVSAASRTDTAPTRFAFAFQLWSLGLGVVPFVVAFLEKGWRTSGKEEEYDLCFFLFFSILLKSILGWKWVELLEM